MAYMLLIMEDPAQRGTRTEAQGREVFQRMACVAGLADWTQTEAFEKCPSLHEIGLGPAYLFGDRAAQEDLAHTAREFGALVSRGDIDPLLEEVIDLEQVPEALVRLKGRHVRGKIVAQIAP